VWKTGTDKSSGGKKTKLLPRGEVFLFFIMTEMKQSSGPCHLKSGDGVGSV